MIKPSEIEDLKAALDIDRQLLEAETNMDAAIRKAIAERKTYASLEFASHGVAIEIEQRYRAAGWWVDATPNAIKVTDTGSDKAYSPRDGWTVRINLEGL